MFNLFEYEFMQNAFILILIISPLFGLLSTMIVNNKLAYFSDALGHSAYLGIGLGLLIGITNNSVISIMAFAIIFSILLTMIKKRFNESPDTVIGIISSISIALGIIVLSSFGGLQKFSQLLVGDLLLVSKDQLLPLAIIAIIVAILFLLIYKKLILISVDQALAKSKGINPMIYEIIFMVIIAINVAISINIIGILLVSALFILPGAIGKLVANNLRQYLAISVVSSTMSGIIGLIVSYYLSIPTGACIILTCGIVYILCTVFIKEK